MNTTWHYDEPTDGILHVKIDRADRPVNSLSRRAIEELQELLDHVGGNPAIQGIIFQSGKAGTFIAGADVTELKDLTSREAARDISQLGQQVFQQLEDLTIPTVALISGACLGGGLEFAMACRYRIADEHAKTVLGLPEVKLGLIPGWGGTVRMPRLLGLITALPLILTGKMINGKSARSRGLVHDCVPTEALPYVGEKIMRTCIDKGTAASLFRPRRKPFWKRILENSGLVKKFALKQAEKQVLANTRGHYPAPLAVVETLRKGLSRSEKAAYAAESETVSRLADDPATTECMRLFFLQEDAKKPPATLDVPVDASAITQTAVIGAGAMGAGIALLLAKKGVWTRLKDLKPEFVSRGMQTVRKLLKTDVQRRKLTKLQASNALDHLSPTTDYRGLKHADVVIEAVLEEIDIKRQVFDDLAQATGPDTVLATNTSSLLVEEIGRDVAHPERVVGLHFFNPPHKMPLVEVIRTDKTSPEALAAALALVARIGKTAVVVGDCAGFLVNRLLSPYMNEAGFLLTELDDPLEIERAAIDFGMPMGPLELTDLVGLDVAAHVANNMHAAYGERMEQAPLWQALPKDAKTGRPSLIKKTKRGKKLNSAVAKVISQLQQAGPEPPLSQEVIMQRLVYPVINEAALCLEEGVAEKPEDIDLAMVFGTGFAPFRGGPLRYADTVGLQNIVETLKQFAVDHPRLAPSEALIRLAEKQSRSPEQREADSAAAVA